MENTFRTQVFILKKELNFSIYLLRITKLDTSQRYYEKNQKEAYNRTSPVHSHVVVNVLERVDRHLVDVLVASNADLMAGVGGERLEVEHQNTERNVFQSIFFILSSFLC